MGRILRGEGPWQEALADALRRAPRPIPVDPRLSPREAAGDEETGRPSWDRAAFPPARPASTLLLVYPNPEGTLTVPLTVRHADLRSHAGEVSLPGGSVDPDDPTDEAAALREAREEIGVDPARIRIIGALDSIWIPVSNYELRPFVGVAAERPPMRPHDAEVASIVELPLPHLVSESSLTVELIEGEGWRLRAGVYRYGGQRIWGATARTLSMFAFVLRLD